MVYKHSKEWKRDRKISKIFASAMVFVFIFSMLLVSKPRAQAQPQWDRYHSYSEIESGLRSLENSGVARVQSIGVSVEGREIWAVKISDDPDIEDGDEPEVLFVGLHHACEWISAEVPYYLAVNLVQNYGVDSTVRTFIDNSEIWIVPVLNPDGLEYSRSGVLDPETGYSSRYWRKNRRDNGDGTHGVDLNRNYDWHWGTDLDPEETSDGSETSGDFTYWGPEAFSEPETRAIRDLIVARSFEVVVSYHSYGQLILYPWGYTESSPDSSAMSLLAAEMSNRIHSVRAETYTPMQGSQLYLVSGEFTDWVYGTSGVPAFTIELRPESADPWWTGFELPEGEILDTCQENFYAAKYLIDIFSPPSVESSTWSGVKKDKFLDQPPISETIFASGFGYEPWTTYNVYVVNDVGTWNDGTPIPSRVPGTETTVSSGGQGILISHPMWGYPPPVWELPITPRNYDIVVDVNDNGVYDVGVDALDNNVEVTTPQLRLSPPLVPMAGNTVWLPSTEALYVAGEGLPSNTEVTIIVTGWFDWGDFPIDLYRGQYLWSYASATATTQADGSLMATLVWWPPITSGDYRILVDVDGNGMLNMGDCWIEYCITISPPEASLWLAPSRGFEGEQIQIYGYDFSAQADIVATTFGGLTLTTSPSTIETDSLGRFVAAFNVPDVGGAYDVYVEDSEGVSATESFTVLQEGGDFDGDGISDEIDLNPTVFSDRFEDFGLGGTTEGVIINRGDQILTITEEPHPAGVRITADPAGGPTVATINILDYGSSPQTFTQLILTAGDEVVATSGSVIIDVMRGVVELEVFVVVVDYAERLAATSLGEGNSISFEPFICTAGESNSDSVIVVVEGQEFPISPGEILRVNRAPVAHAQSVVTNEDTPRAISLIASDADDDPLTYSVIDAPLHGILSGIAPNVVYTPDPDYHGVDSFSFSVNDGMLNSETALVTITIAPVNDLPAACAGGPYEGFEDSPIIFDAGCSTDPEEDVLQYRWDFDGDGIWDTEWSSSPTASHTWCDEWAGSAIVEVSDGLQMVVIDGLPYDRPTDTDVASVTVDKICSTIESCDADGNKVDSFAPSDTVYVTGSGYSPSKDFKLYIVNDIITWSDGMGIPDPVLGTETIVTSDASGNIPPQAVWSPTPTLTLGKYDIVVDVDGDNIYDEGLDALDNGDIEVAAGFFVIPEVPLGTAMTLLSMFFAVAGFLGFKRFRLRLRSQ